MSPKFTPISSNEKIHVVVEASNKRILLVEAVGYLYIDNLGKTYFKLSTESLTKLKQSGLKPIGWNPNLITLIPIHKLND